MRFGSAQRYPCLRQYEILISHLHASITSITRFSYIVKKLNISAIYKSIILIFSENLPLVFIIKFYMKEIQI